MNITTFHVGRHAVRLGNDQFPGEPECWKTSIDGSIWTPGLGSMGDAITAAIADILTDGPDCARCAPIRDQVRV